MANSTYKVRSHVRVGDFSETSWWRIAWSDLPRDEGGPIIRTPLVTVPIRVSVLFTLPATSKDFAFRERWEKTALARAVALRLVAYRGEHALSQSALGRLLQMKQPAVARLE